MPFVPYDRPFTEQLVSDKASGSVRLKQLARVYSLFYHQELNGLSVAKLLVYVYLHLPDETQPGGLGPRLSPSGLPDYKVELSADNGSVVAFPGGELLATRTTQTDAEWAQVLDKLADTDTMYQGDYFAWVRDHQPVLLGSVFGQYIQQADAAGRFA